MTLLKNFSAKEDIFRCFLGSGNERFSGPR